MPANSMNVINFNRKQLPQRDKFINRLGGYNPDKKTEYNLPKATAKQLKEIGKRLKEERKVRMFKIILLTVVVLISFICIWAYLADGIVQFLNF
tara:strand:- start:199 stop:480 length:282 start_codon:yes stop_codon:yes gene_type:complete